jgi:hypothetical protein
MDICRGEVWIVYDIDQLYHEEITDEEHQDQRADAAQSGALLPIPPITELDRLGRPVAITHLLFAEVHF